MIFFRRKKKTTSHIADYSVLRSDVHSHLLPGIDDGSPDFETSVHLIKGMKRLGYKKLITTPHIMWDVYKNTSDIISNKLQELKGRLADEQVDIEVQGAAEYFVQPVSLSSMAELVNVLNERWFKSGLVRDAREQRLQASRKHKDKG